MLYHLFHALEEYSVPGARLFEYITFRSGMALVLSLFIAIVFGRKIISRLQLMQVAKSCATSVSKGRWKRKARPPWVA